MRTLADDIHKFLNGKAACHADAIQRVALQLICGLDLPEILAADLQSRRSALARIERQIRRERQKGLARHWSYDLNRHIALKQARDRIVGTLTACETERKGRAVDVAMTRP